MCPERKPLATALLAVVLTTSAVLLGTVVSPTEPANAAARNLVVNASLEQGVDWPTCFSPVGWGTEGAWSLVPGRSGQRAVSLTVTGYASGDRKLIQSESNACAPAVTAGMTYSVGAKYKSTAPVALTVFRHTPAGWSYWGELADLAPKTAWAQATAVTPPIPEGTDRLSFGISLSRNGTLVTDDYTLIAAGAGAQKVNLVTNGNLATGTPTPDCFFTAGWGGHTTQAALNTNVPAGSPAGSRSYRVALTKYVSGDAKLLPSEDVGCAPPTTPGSVYDVSVAYKSTATANGLTAFQHTVNGWSYWTELASLPAAAAWTTATATLPPIPAGVDRISFGVSIASNGVLFTTNYSMVEVDPVVVPTPPVDSPLSIGAWTVLDAKMPLRAIHTTLLHDGRLLLIAGSGNDGNQFAAGTFRASVWNPTTNVYTDVPVPYDMFCAGHLTLPDGKVLIAGGTQAFPTQDQGPNTFKGSKKSYYFDPADNVFHPLADMAGAHWYPTLTKLGNGDVWSAGGLDEKAEGTVLTEIFDTSAMTWLPSNQVPQTWSYWGTYPHMYLLDDGMLFYAGAHTFGNGLPGTGASLYDWTTAQMWDVPGLREKNLRDQAGSVLLPPAQDQKVMIVGGGNTETNLPAINLVDIVDLSTATPTYTPGPALPGAGKMYVNLVTLPNRTVLAADGATSNRAGNVDTAAIYDPLANSWSSIAPDPVGRNYHSSSLLLPDGRVVVFASNPADNSFELRVSIYSPSYLFKGTRPTVTKSPQVAGYGTSFPLGVTGDVVSASLIPPMSPTHQTDTNARLVDLPIAGVGANRVAQIPNNPNLVPPGPYMLTVLDSAGIPSTAVWIWIS